MEKIEIETTLAHRWWALDELRSTSDVVLPNVLALVETVLADPN